MSGGNSSLLGRARRFACCSFCRGRDRLTRGATAFASDCSADSGSASDLGDSALVEC